MPEVLKADPVQEKPVPETLDPPTPTPPEASGTGSFVVRTLLASGVHSKGTLGALRNRNGLKIYRL